LGNLEGAIKEGKVVKKFVKEEGKKKWKFKSGDLARYIVNDGDDTMSGF
jgi:hypothetical protein